MPGEKTEGGEFVLELFLVEVECTSLKSHWQEVYFA